MSGVREPGTDEAGWETTDLVRTSDVMVEHEHVRMRHLREASRPRLRLNLTAMIDVVFLLLMYFLLIAEFKPREERFDMTLPRDTTATESDPFALPRTPIRIEVRSLGDAAGEYALASSSPLLGELSRGNEGLHERLIALKEGVVAEDQRFIIAPVEDALWEHSLGVLNTLKRAGFTEIRFAEPTP